MLTVKLCKYREGTLGTPNGIGQTPTPAPSDTAGESRLDEFQSLRSAHVIYQELDKHGRTVLRLERETGEMEAFTIGTLGRHDVMYHAAFIMNEAGKTIDTIR